MVASRTPQPAIDIGSIVISITGGTNWKTGQKSQARQSLAPHTRRSGQRALERVETE